MIHFSVDDVIDIFKNLSRNSYSSCFEEPTLAFFKELYERYGFSVALYCFFEDGSGFDLTGAPRSFCREFCQNAHWLHFGFHGLNRYSDYSRSEPRQLLSDADKVYSNLRQIVSESALTYNVRLSFAAGTFDCIAALRKAYPRFHTLYGADDLRIEYYLSQAENSVLLDRGFFRDDRLGITIRLSAPRLEKYDCQPVLPDRDSCAFFTHECRLAEPETRRRILWLCGRKERFCL